jgi:hypothetical protein
MRKNPPLTRAALKRRLAAIHPDPEIAKELLAMGIYRAGTGGRLRYGRCGPMPGLPVNPVSARRWKITGAPITGDLAPEHAHRKARSGLA